MERKKVKYTFEEEEQNTLDTVWEGNEDLQQTAARLFIAHKAKGTMEQYNPVQKEFKEYCEATEGLSYQIMGEKEVRYFITHCANKQKGAAFWMKFKPSLEQLQVCRNRSAAQTAFTAYNNALIAGAKREANLRKGITKKKDALEVEALKKGLIQEYGITALTGSKTSTWSRSGPCSDGRSAGRPYPGLKTLLNYKPSTSASLETTQPYRCSFQR